MGEKLWLFKKNCYVVLINVRFSRSSCWSTTPANLPEFERSTTPIFGLEFGVEFTPNFAGVVMLCLAVQPHKMKLPFWNPDIATVALQVWPPVLNVSQVSTSTSTWIRHLDSVLPVNPADSTIFFTDGQDFNGFDFLSKKSKIWRPSIWRTFR